MTSIMHPGTYARLNAVQARAELQRASVALRHEGDRLPLVGIPEHDGPDSPDNPWYVKPTPGIIGPVQQATANATAAITKIETALGVRNQLSAGAVTALGRARDEALAGVGYLKTPITAPIDTSRVPLMFDAGAMWLDLAINLIDLDMRGGRPPVTILPVPGPGEPGSPITIQPYPPVKELPIEVEAPEAIGRPTEVEAPEAIAR